MQFEFAVRDPLGRQHQGFLDAVSSEEARQKLRQDGFRVLSLRESRQAAGRLWGKRIARREIVYMTSQLAIMVDTGITLSVALESLSEEEENPAMQTLLLDLRQTVEGGEEFSKALEKHPQYFDQTYLSLVRASEASGMLAEMLERIAVYQRKQLDTRARVRSAMAYPIVMAVVALAVTLFLLIYILPKFEPLFAKKGQELPAITLAMMQLSDGLIGYWYIWLAAVVAVVGGLMYAHQTPRGQQAIDWMKINLPIFGPMFRKVTISRSVHTLGTLISSGVSVLEALRLSADVAGNVYYQQIWQRVVEQVTGGSQIYETLSGSQLFPSMLVQMMRSGEETGRLDHVLNKVSAYYDGEVETSLKTVTSLIEPLLIVVMGVVVGGIALGLLLPIFTMAR